MRSYVNSVFSYRAQIEICMLHIPENMHSFPHFSSAYYTHDWQHIRKESFCEKQLWRAIVHHIAKRDRVFMRWQCPTCAHKTTLMTAFLSFPSIHCPYPAQARSLSLFLSSRAGDVAEHGTDRGSVQATRNTDSERRARSSSRLPSLGGRC